MDNLGANVLAQGEQNFPIDLSEIGGRLLLLLLLLSGDQRVHHRSRVEVERLLLLDEAGHRQVWVQKIRVDWDRLNDRHQWWWWW